MSLTEYAVPMMERYRTGDYAGALDLAYEAAERFPDRGASTLFWQSCLLALLDRPDEALSRLEQGLADGHWWSPAWLRAEEDLVALRELPRFDAVMAECARRSAAVQAGTRPELFTAPPSHTPPDPGPFPTLVVLHGRGLNGADTLDLWAAPASAGWLVAAPQSSQPIGTEAFGWDDRELAAREVVDHLRVLESEHGADPRRLVLAGFSAGADVALRLAFGLVVDVRGYVVAAPSIREPEALLALAGDDPVRGAMLVGDGDFVYPAARQVADALGAACELRVYPGLGHDLPPTFSADLTEVLARW